MCWSSFYMFFCLFFFNWMRSTFMCLNNGCRKYWRSTVYLCQLNSIWSLYECNGLWELAVSCLDAMGMFYGTGVWITLPLRCMRQLFPLPMYTSLKPPRGGTIPSISFLCGTRRLRRFFRTQDLRKDSDPKIVSFISLNLNQREEDLQVVSVVSDG